LRTTSCAACSHASSTCVVRRLCRPLCDGASRRARLWCMGGLWCMLHRGAGWARATGHSNTPAPA
jgi:hypothetical protein